MLPRKSHSFFAAVVFTKKCCEAQGRKSMDCCLKEVVSDLDLQKLSCLNSWKKEVAGPWEES
jgi:hypothetical protein